MKILAGRKINSGFSLIEVLIAIFLIGVAFVGVVAFFNSSLQSHFDSKSELIAAGLAQEGSELIRNLRDYKLLNGESWSGLTNQTTGLPACERIDYHSLESSHTCYGASTGDDVCLRSDGRYEQCSSGGIGLKRTITVTCEDQNNNPIANCTGSVKSLKIVSTVTWNDRTTEATDRLYENSY